MGVLNVNVTLYCSINCNCKSGVNCSSVMTRVDPYNVPRKSVARPQNRCNELKQSIISLELLGKNRSAIESRRVACDTETTIKMTENNEVVT